MEFSDSRKTPQASVARLRSFQESSCNEHGIKISYADYTYQLYLMLCTTRRDRLQQQCPLVSTYDGFDPGLGFMSNMGYAIGLTKSRSYLYTLCLDSFCEQLKASVIEKRAALPGLAYPAKGCSDTQNSSTFSSIFHFFLFVTHTVSQAEHLSSMYLHLQLLAAT